MSDNATLQGSGWKYNCCQIADAARREGYDYGMEKAAACIAELEAERDRLREALRADDVLTDLMPLKTSRDYREGWMAGANAFREAVRARAALSPTPSGETTKASLT